MIVAGPLVGVEEKPEGSAAAAAASAGATSVVVDNGNHFREFGICQIGDASYVYTLGEDDVTLTLDDPLAADVEIGDLVLSLTDTALSESQVFAFVQLEDSQPPVRAVVPYAMRTLALSDSLRIGGVTQIEATPDGYSVQSLPFDDPAVDPAKVATPHVEGYLFNSGANLSIPNGTDTAVTGWIMIDEVGGWTTDGTYFYPPRTGRYLCTFGGAWASNATGSRGATIVRARPGTSYDTDWYDRRPGAAGLTGLTNLVVNVIDASLPIHAIGCRVSQTSGAALDLLQGITLTRFSATWIADTA